MVKCAVHVTQGGTEGTVLRKGYGKKIANLLPNGFRRRYIFTSADSKSGSCELGDSSLLTPKKLCISWFDRAW